MARSRSPASSPLPPFVRPARDEDGLGACGRHDVETVLRAVVDVVVEPEGRGGRTARPGNHQDARQIEALRHEPALRLPLHGLALVHGRCVMKNTSHRCWSISWCMRRTAPRSSGCSVVQKSGVARISDQIASRRRRVSCGFSASFGLIGCRGRFGGRFLRLGLARRQTWRVPGTSRSSTSWNAGAKSASTPSMSKPIRSGSQSRRIGSRESAHCRDRAISS